MITIYWEERYRIKREFKRFFSPIGCFLAGVIAILFCLYNLYSCYDFKKTAKVTSATISNIKETKRYVKLKHGGKKYKTEKSFIISYTANGTTYSDVDLEYHNNFKDVGDTININYEINNPRNIKYMPGELTSSLYSFLIGATAILIPIILPGRDRRRDLI